MFGIDGPELLVIIIVLIVVIGPKDLPKMMRAFGKAAARLRVTAHEFREQFDEAMREADIHDAADHFHDVKKLDPRHDLKQIFDPFRSAAQDIGEAASDAAAPRQPAKPAPAAADDSSAPLAGEEAAAPVQKSKKQNAAKTGGKGA